MVYTILINAKAGLSKREVVRVGNISNNIARNAKGAYSKRAKAKIATKGKLTVVKLHTTADDANWLAKRLASKLPVQAQVL